MKKTLTTRRGGFTLIELMVVIAIISILTAIVFASLNTARMKARDNQRLANLKQLQTAIEVYGQSTGRYPAAGCSNGISWTGHGTNYGSCVVYIDGISDLISPLPVDPTNTTQGFIYRTNVEQTAYKLMIFNSVESETVGATHEFARYRQVNNCSGDMTIAANTKTYAVYGGSAASCW